MTDARARRRGGGPSPGFMLALIGAALIAGLLLRAMLPAP
jgi:hypothetical protein